MSLQGVVMVNGESYPIRSQPPDGNAEIYGIDDPVPSPCVVPAQARDITIEDWDILCAAVQARLGMLVEGQHTGPTEGFAGTTLDRIRAGVLDSPGRCGPTTW